MATVRRLYELLLQGVEGKAPGPKELLRAAAESPPKQLKAETRMTTKLAIAIFVVVASESLVTMNVAMAITAGMVGSDALGTRRPHTQGRPNETHGLRHDDVFGEAAAGIHPQHRLRHVYLPLG